MCIVQGESLKEVSATKIFVTPLPRNLQATVYSNKIAFEGRDVWHTQFRRNAANNTVGITSAMILPYPNDNPKEKAALLDLSSYEYLFEECSPSIS